MRRHLTPRLPRLTRALKPGLATVHAQRPTVPMSAVTTLGRRLTAGRFFLGCAVVATGLLACAAAQARELAPSTAFTAQRAGASALPDASTSTGSTTSTSTSTSASASTTTSTSTGHNDSHRSGPGTTVPAPTAGQILEGLSLDVQDGDTFVFRSDSGQRLRIRVAGIDAPEKSQPYADRSRQHLRELFRERRLKVAPIKQDVFGRTVARIEVLQDSVTVDAAMAQLQAGLAWHFKRYKADQTRDEFVRYAQAEREARAARIGLWTEPEPQAPWVFRAANRSGGTARSERP